ncbi:hypothetical protein Dsin_012702 [Dipteronia sinensis]|uniref:RNase H type-1 domain-containing protein n=1 Tax=Dipteronia sinensis TaxID=43782 RepID=A0AAE0AIK6_9ROSI|nr:hypothetical protein Dsin_012702 [Dipteronia sinensis]
MATGWAALSALILVRLVQVLYLMFLSLGGNLFGNSKSRPKFSSQRIEASFSPQVAEALAISRGLQLAIDTGLHPCRIESDEKIVVDWINNGEVLCSEIGNVIADIRSLLENEHCVSLNFISKKANQVAHVLVKNGLTCAEDLFWLEEFPPLLVLLLRLSAVFVCNSCFS